MAKFLSVNLLGLFVLSSSYASMEEQDRINYEPRKPATQAQIYAALEVAKNSLNLAARVASKEVPSSQPTSSSSDDEEFWEGSDSDSSNDEGFWEESDSDSSDEDAPVSPPEPVVKRVTVEEARRMQRLSFQNQSLDLDKKIAALNRLEKEKKKLEVCEETMKHRDRETQAFYAKSASAPQTLNRDGRKLTKAFATPSFTRKPEEDRAS